MDMITILQAVMRWGIPALACGAAVFFLLAIAYLIYKKIVHGKRTATRTQAVCTVLLCCCLILVFGLTSLNWMICFTI